MTNFFAAIIAFITALLGRKQPDPIKEARHDVEIAKQDEAAFVAPPRDKQSVIERMRQRAEDR